MVNPAYIKFSSIEKIVKNFPFLTILPIVGEHNYKTIAEVHFKVNENYAPVQSNIGDGQLGLL